MEVFFGATGVGTFIGGMAAPNWLVYTNGSIGLWQKVNTTVAEVPVTDSITFGDCSDYVDGTRACLIAGVVTCAGIVMSAALWERRKKSVCFIQILAELLMTVQSVVSIIAVSLYGYDGKNCYSQKYPLPDVSLGTAFVLSCVSPVLLLLASIKLYYVRYKEYKSSGNQVRPNVVTNSRPGKSRNENSPSASTSNSAQGPSTSSRTAASQRSSSGTTNSVFTIEINNLRNGSNQNISGAQNHLSSARAWQNVPSSITFSENPPPYTVYPIPDTVSPPPSYEEVIQQGSVHAEAPSVIRPNATQDSNV